MNLANNFRGFIILLVFVLSVATASCEQERRVNSPNMSEPIPTATSTATWPSPIVAAVLPTPEPTTIPAPEPVHLPPVSLIITNGLLIDVTGANPIADGLVAIEGNRIVAVGKAADFQIPDDVQIIDAAGGTIMPGVINAHIHNGNAVGTRRILFLLDGVTSVCDLGIPLFMLSGFEEEGFKAGPAARGFKAGSVITAPGGYPGNIMGAAMNYEIQGVEEAEMAVRDLKERGVDYIKVVLEPGFRGENLPVITPEELRAVVATAHANDLLVRAHVTKSDMLRLAMDGGVDVIEHVPLGSESPEVLEAMYFEPGLFLMPSEQEAQILRMIDQGVVLVPTLEVYLADPYLLAAIEPETDVRNHAIFQAILGVVRYFHDSGGIIALGNDYGNPGVQSGMPLREMELLNKAGLSPYEIIEAATKNAAYVCGHDDELGTLEKGKLADLIVVDGNPLLDLKAMDSLLYVVKDGEIVLSPELGG